MSTCINDIILRNMLTKRQETLRYLRMGNATLEPEFEKRLSEVERQMTSAARPAAYWQLVPIEWESNDSYTVGSLRLNSKHLARELKGCRHAYLFCATLGAGVDALMRRYGTTSPASLVMAQAVAAAMIESYCDECERDMLAEPAVSGETLRMRYAPGYGDLPIETQRSLMTALDAPRRAGITLTETMMMIPSKSISAIIGVGPRRTNDDYIA